MSLLTVCIPTYRRLALLQESLGQLLPEADALGIKVFVCDNASGDGTADFLAKAKQKHDCLEYKVNDTTVSIDENMFYAMSWPSSTYIYPLGDDDFLPPGSLTKILDLLKASPDLLLLRFKIVDAFLRTKDFTFPPCLPGALFEDPRVAFGDIWELLHFGAFVVRGELCEGWFLHYFGTSHAYSGAVWEMLANKYASAGSISIKCSDEELVLIRDAGKTWSDSRIQILYQGIPMWFDLLPSLYREKARAARNIYYAQKVTVKALLKLRKKAMLSRSNLEMFKYQNEDYRAKLAAVCAIPKCFASLLYRIIKLIKPRKRHARISNEAI